MITVKFWTTLKFISLLILVTPLFSACTESKTEARSAIEEHLKTLNPRSIEIDFFHTDSNFPDKAYVGATVTYNFSTAEGTFQKEYLGYILKKEGGAWKVAENTGYTKDPSKANSFMSGRKS